MQVAHRPILASHPGMPNEPHDWAKLSLIWSIQVVTPVRALSRSRALYETIMGSRSGRRQTTHQVERI